jgi:hypothetical protein
MSIHIHLIEGIFTMNFRRNYLSAAVVAALAGGVAPGDVGAVTLSQDNIGDAAIVPYYTMRDGWATDFYIINTSSSTTAVKVSFHEARNSRDVLDFIVVLSPYDRINFWAALGNDGPAVQFPKLNSEKSCVVPVPTDRVDGVGGSFPFSAVEYTGSNYDNYPISGSYDSPLGALDRTLEGYMEVIEMGTTEKGDVYSASLHPDPKCDEIADAFLPSNIVDTYNQFGRNLNNLKVGFSLTNVARGTSGADTATMLSNFATAYSWIDHTYTSTIATANTAALDIQTAQGKVNDALDGVAAAKARMCSSGITVCSDLTNGTAGPPDQCADPQGTSNPSVAGVNAACGTGTGSIGEQYNNAISELATAQAELTEAQNALNNVNLGPAKNLIAAQDGLGFSDQERYPNLNSGDFVAYWLVDGKYQKVGNYDQAPFGWWFSPFGLWWGVYARPVDAVTALLMKSDAINEWAYNPNTGASADLVMTAPTKRWYADWYNVYKNNVHLVGISPLLEEVVQKTNVGWPPFGNQFVTLGESCDQVGMGFWNNDELAKAYHQVPSPTPTIDLCWETNVVYTGDSSVLGTDVGQQFDVRSLFGAGVPENMTYNGWLDLKMTMSPHNYHPAIPWLNFTMPNFFGELTPLPWDSVVQVGMPYIGFAYKERDFGNARASYGSIADHSYTRNWDYRNAIGGTWQTFNFTTTGLNFPQPENFIPQGN